MVLNKAETEPTVLQIQIFFRLYLLLLDTSHVCLLVVLVFITLLKFIVHLKGVQMDSYSCSCHVFYSCFYFASLLFCLLRKVLAEVTNDYLLCRANLSQRVLGCAPLFWCWLDFILWCNLVLVSVLRLEDCKLDFPRFLLGDDRGEMMLCFSLTSTGTSSLWGAAR